jgi:hypothetical protein
MTLVMTVDCFAASVTLGKQDNLVIVDEIIPSFLNA